MKTATVTRLVDITRGPVQRRSAAAPSIDRPEGIVGAEIPPTSPPTPLHMVERGAMVPFSPRLLKMGEKG